MATQPMTLVRHILLEKYQKWNNLPEDMYWGSKKDSGNPPESAVKSKD